MKRRISMLAVALALALTPCLAGVGEGQGELGFDLGYTDFDSDVSRDDGGRVTFRGGYFFSDLFELEGELAASVAEDAGVDVALTTFTVNAVLNFRAGDDVVLYFLGGIGTARLTYDLGAFSIDDDGIARQLAFGSRFFFGSAKRVAVRVEVAFLTENTFDESSNHTSLTGGFTWRLGAGR